MEKLETSGGLACSRTLWLNYLQLNSLLSNASASACLRSIEWATQVHTCHDPCQALLDFGVEGELFLAELHLTELLALSIKRPTPLHAKPEAPKVSHSLTQSEAKAAPIPPPRLDHSDEAR